MDYQQTLEYIYARVPAFHQVGAAAYKPGLERVQSLMARYGHPERALRCVHVAGTNGKGSTSHSLAALFQAAGYRTGLFTSPHLVDFRERIRVDGQMPPRQWVVDFVADFDFDNSDATFFEIATAMALLYFAQQQVDIAIIETGLGGRLDSTNIVTPDLSVITNIGMDHTALLGDTLPKIAAEKAGIIKPGRPVVVGEAPQPEVAEVFAAKAAQCGSDITFAQPLAWQPDGRYILYPDTPFGPLRCDLTGPSQHKNMATVVAALQVLRRLGWQLPDSAIAAGLADVQGSTGLMGRWMTVRGTAVPTIADTGHNGHAWQYNAPALAALPRPLVAILGFVDDKDIDAVLGMLPQAEGIEYIFTQPSTHRALPAPRLQEMARRHGIDGPVADTVAQAYDMAMQAAPAQIFVGGSTYLVADLLAR